MFLHMGLGDSLFSKTSDVLAIGFTVDHGKMFCDAREGPVETALAVTDNNRFVCIKRVERAVPYGCNCNPSNPKVVTSATTGINMGTEK